MVDRSNENWESLERKGYYTLTEKDNSFPGASANITPPRALADTGDRTTVGGGAQRDMGGHKGRCDLLPLDIVGNILGDDFFNLMDSFIYEQDNIELIYQAFNLVLERSQMEMNTAFLELAKHY